MTKARKQIPKEMPDEMNLLFALFQSDNKVQVLQLKTDSSKEIITLYRRS